MMIETDQDLEHAADTIARLRDAGEQEGRIQELEAAMTLYVARNRERLFSGAPPITPF